MADLAPGLGRSPQTPKAQKCIVAALMQAIGVERAHLTTVHVEYLLKIACGRLRASSPPASSL